MAIGLETELARFGQPDSYFKQLPAMLLEKRDRMAKVLEEVGLDPIVPDGGYFMLADTTSLGRIVTFELDGGPAIKLYIYLIIKVLRLKRHPSKNLTRS